MANKYVANIHKKIIFTNFQRILALKCLLPKMEPTNCLNTCSLQTGGFIIAAAYTIICGWMLSYYLILIKWELTVKERQVLKENGNWNLLIHVNIGSLTAMIVMCLALTVGVVNRHRCLLGCWLAYGLVFIIVDIGTKITFFELLVKVSQTIYVPWMRFGFIIIRIIFMCGFWAYSYYVVFGLFLLYKGSSTELAEII